MCKQDEFINVISYILFVCVLSLQTPRVVYIHITSQLSLVTLQMTGSHGWLMASVLDRSLETEEFVEDRGTQVGLRRKWGLNRMDIKSPDFGCF